VVDYVRLWNERTEIPAGQFVGWLGITPSKFHDWRRRYGKVNEHNAWVPRDWWLDEQAVEERHGLPPADKTP
jgi:putative transposase